MKNIKRISAIMILAIITVMMIPSTAFAATDFEISSIGLSPDTVSIDGGSVNVSVTVKNTGTDPITNVSYTYHLPSGLEGRGHADTISVGASKTYTDNIQFNGNDVNTNIQAEVWCQGVGWISHSKTFSVTGEDNVILSGDEIVPEKSSYFVGETVSITDTMRNSLSTNVTNLKMKYYLRRSGSDTSGDTVTFGTVAPNAKVSNTLDYTFTEEDLDGLRIGSSITYNVSGNGPYTEYNVAHDFVVVPSPTPTSSTTPTASATPTPTPEATPTATEQPATSEIVIQQEANPQEETAAIKEDTGTNTTTSLFQDRTIVMTIIIVVGAIVALVIIVIIVAVAKKK